VLGAQEVLPDQLDVLLDALGDGYHHVGRGRGSRGDGEATPVLYDGQRLDLVEWEQAALSDTPSRAGSTSWGNLIPRVVVAATFRDRLTTARFVVVNTHLDPLSGRSRTRSVRAIRRRVVDSGLPAVVTGDLNAGRGSATVREFLAGDTLVDTWESADTRMSEDWGTYAGYRPPRRGGRRLDWILVTPTVRVLRAAVNPCHGEHAGASDHLPVRADLLVHDGRQLA